VNLLELDAEGELDVQELLDGYADELRANLEALPGFGEMKIASLMTVLDKRFGIKAARGVRFDMPTMGDIDSPEKLAEYQDKKKAWKQKRGA